MIEKVVKCDSGNLADCVLSDALGSPGSILYDATRVAYCMGGDPYTPPAMMTNPKIYSKCPISKFGHGNGN